MDHRKIGMINEAFDIEEEYDIDDSYINNLDACKNKINVDYDMARENDDNIIDNNHRDGKKLQVCGKDSYENVCLRNVRKLQPDVKHEKDDHGEESITNNVNNTEDVKSVNVDDNRLKINFDDCFENSKRFSGVFISFREKSTKREWERRSVRRYDLDNENDIRSMERDYCVQALAQLLQGYGFGAIIEMFDRVMCAERIVRLNVTPFSPMELVADMAGEEQLTLEDYKMYEDFFIANSPLKKPRAEFLDINIRRADVYQKLAKKEKTKEK